MTGLPALLLGAVLGLLTTLRLPLLAGRHVRTRTSALGRCRCEDLMHTCHDVLGLRCFHELTLQSLIFETLLLCLLLNEAHKAIHQPVTLESVQVIGGGRHELLERTEVSVEPCAETLMCLGTRDTGEPRNECPGRVLDEGDDLFCEAITDALNKNAKILETVETRALVLIPLHNRCLEISPHSCERVDLSVEIIGKGEPALREESLVGPLVHQIVNQLDLLDQGGHHLAVHVNRHCASGLLAIWRWVVDESFLRYSYFCYYFSIFILFVKYFIDKYY